MITTLLLFRMNDHVNMKFNGHPFTNFEKRPPAQTAFQMNHLLRGLKPFIGRGHHIGSTFGSPLSQELIVSINRLRSGNELRHIVIEHSRQFQLVLDTASIGGAVDIGSTTIIPSAFF